MTSKLQLLLVVFLASASGVALRAQENSSANQKKKQQDEFAHVRKILDKSVTLDPETLGVKDGDSLAKVLQTFAKTLPEDWNVELRVDGHAFGKELSRLVMELNGRPLPKARDISLGTAIKQLISRLPQGVRADICIQGNRIIVTRPKLAAYTAEYDVADLLQNATWLFDSLDLYDTTTLPTDLKPAERLAKLLDLTYKLVEFREWETVHALNGTRLSVRANLATQDGLEQLIRHLRRLLEMRVVMNARIYEVDSDFFAENIRPALRSDEEATSRGGLICPKFCLVKQIMKQKLIVEGDDVMLHPRLETTFVAKQSVLPRCAGLEGVCCDVRPFISPDRRFLRLNVTQSVAQLVAIDKEKRRNPLTGHEELFEVPNIRNSSVKGTITIPDGGALLMPLDYRPTGKGKDEKFWVLVARPVIWIKDEEELLQKEGGSQKSIWERELPKDEEEPARRPTPLSSEAKAILQAAITDALTNEDFKKDRAKFGREKDKTVIVEDSKTLVWSKELQLDTHGYKRIEPVFDPFMRPHHVLTLGVSKMDLKKRDDMAFDGEIEIFLRDSGDNGMPSRYICYKPKWIGDHWGVELVDRP